MTQKTLEGRVALVTGSSRGIGRGIADRFAREGASVAITWLKNEASALSLAESIQKDGGNAICLNLDVTHRASIKHAVASTLENLGGLDIVVNNAGFLEQKPFETIGDKDWDYTFDCNLKSAFMFGQEVHTHFSNRGRGNLINITSIGGQTGGIKAPHYAAAKAGLISLTKSLAKIYAPDGVRVNAISPGYIHTDMYTDIATREDEEAILSTIPLGRIGESADVAGAAVYLASDESSYITGHVLNVNGGFYLG